MLTNSTLYALFHPTHHTPAKRGFAFLSTSQHAHHDHDSAPSVGGTFWPLLLVALLSSHVFLIVRSVVRYVLTQVMWESSDVREGGKAKEERVRAEYLERHQGEVGQLTLGEGAGGERMSAGMEGFWRGGDGREVESVEGLYKME